MVGGRELPPEPVQPRDAGRAAAGLGVQAVRARRRARRRDRAVDDARLEAGHDRHRRPPLAGEQLRGRVPRPDRPDEGDRVLGQLGLRPADGHRRAGRRSSGPRSSSGSRPRSSRTSRSGSARSRRRRSRWRARSARFANGGYRIDGSIFRNAPRAVECLMKGKGRSCSKENAIDAAAGARPRLGRERRARGDRRLAAPGRRPVRDGHRGGAARPRGRRQDRHDGELRRRVVRRLHARARDGGLGRVSEQAPADADRVPRRTRSPAGRTRR